jgi:hypothetical protein
MMLWRSRGGQEERPKRARMSRRRETRPAVLEVAILLLSGVFAASEPAQVTTSTQPGTCATLRDLAKSVHNPFEDFVKVPLQSTTGFSIGRITTRERALTFSR